MYADPLFTNFLAHLTENLLRHSGGRVTQIVIIYHATPGWLGLCFRDNGKAIPAEKRQQVFKFDAGGSAGIGLFICRQIVEVTGMMIEGDRDRRGRGHVHQPRPTRRVSYRGNK
ncbi:MAG: ATP-binding protein [Methanomicrobiales archaeon]